jgi:Putative DNA-binding domain
MPGSGWSIYTAAEADVTAELLDTFLAEQLRDRQFLESMTLELKRERRGHGVPDAVCALANSAGGLVIVGIDEREPSLSGAPGVSPESVVSLSDQLRGALGPLVSPEIIPISARSAGNVVLLIRIEADPLLWPVVSNGRVMVRNPGQSVAATHEQILDLVRRRVSANGAGGTSYSLSTFGPSAVMPEEREKRGDLLIRLATAVYSRPRVSSPLRIGSEERLHLCDAFASSPFGRIFDRQRPRNSSRLRPHYELAEEEYSSSHFVVAANIEEGEHVGRLMLKVIQHGNQIAVVIEIEVRRPRPASDSAERHAPSASRSELTFLAICALETLSQTMVPALVDLIGGAPIHVDDIYLWAQSPATQDLSRILSLDGARRLVPSTRSSWGAQLRQVADQDDAVGVLRPALETFYIDLGLDHERDLANRDLEDGVRSRRWQD